MGDPKKIRKKYSTPRHPWEKVRIDEEKELTRNYGFANKKEIWKINSKLKSFKDQSKNLAAGTGKQVEKEKKQLLQKLQRISLLSSEQELNEVLGVGVSDLSERRLQTIVYKKSLARTMKQARQMIVHRHITVNNTKITSPSYVVSITEEPTVSFASDSPFFDESHPERKPQEIAEKPEEKEELELKKQREQKKPVQEKKTQEAKKEESAKQQKEDVQTTKKETEEKQPEQKSIETEKQEKPETTKKE